MKLPNNTEVEKLKREVVSGKFRKFLMLFGDEFDDAMFFVRLGVLTSILGVTLSVLTNKNPMDTLSLTLGIFLAHVTLVGINALPKRRAFPLVRDTFDIMDNSTAKEFTVELINNGEEILNLLSSDSSVSLNVKKILNDAINGEINGDVFFCQLKAESGSVYEYEDGDTFIKMGTGRVCVFSKNSPESRLFRYIALEKLSQHRKDKRRREKTEGQRAKDEAILFTLNKIKQGE